MKINFYFQALIEQSLIKTWDFNESNNKVRFTCLLAPAEVVAMCKLAAEFLKRKYRKIWCASVHDWDIDLKRHLYDLESNGRLS